MRPRRYFSVLPSDLWSHYFHDYFTEQNGLDHKCRTPESLALQVCVFVWLAVLLVLFKHSF